MKSGKSPTISVVLIAKNEEAVLSRVLSSIKDADEIIVCDTGSVDKTIEVAKKFTDKVYDDYKWEKSFAKARNHAKSKATCEWILSIDADEKLDVPFSKVREAVEEAERRGALAVNIKLHADDSENGHFVKEDLSASDKWHWFPRVFKNVPEVWWEGAVHNHISVAAIDDKEDGVRIIYGYSPAHHLDPNRSLDILETEVNTRENAVREAFYLGREYYYRSRFDECITTLGKYVQKSVYPAEKADAFLIMSMAYFQKGQPEDAKDACLQAIKVNPNFKEAILFMATLVDQKHIGPWKKMAEIADESEVLFVRPPARHLFISPHDDDNVLFGAFTCIREKPTVMVVLDSYIQPARGEQGCSAEERAKETTDANDILGCAVERLGIHDDEVTEEILEAHLKTYDVYDVVYAPALQGGNPHHDMISRVCDKVFGSRVMHYTTYEKTKLWTRGVTEIVPTPKELEIKNRALACYVSQIAINKPHFDAVEDKSEWLGYWPGLYLGAGSHRMPGGWTYLDAYPFPGIDVVCDVTMGLPFPNNSFHRVYSQDFLEHTPQEKKVFIMNEIWRVLKPNGYMEHIIPKAGSANDFGSPSHISHWSLQQFEHWDIDSYRYEKDRYYEGFKGAFKKVFAEEATDGQTIHVKMTAIK